MEIFLWKIDLKMLINCIWEQGKWNVPLALEPEGNENECLGVRVWN